MFGLKRKAKGNLDSLDPRTGERLKRFGAQFDEIGAAEFLMFAGPDTPDAHLQAAMDRALEELRATGQRDVAKRAVATVTDAAARRYAEDLGVTELFGLRAIRGGTAADRVRVLKSLERAVVAVILWDRLDDETRVALAGPWGRLVEAAVGEP